jgi:hypothetical protein
MDHTAGGIPLPNEMEQANEEIGRLKAALRAAILSTHRVTQRCVDYDPAGSTYEIDWAPEVREWSALCGLDIDSYHPPVTPENPPESDLPC